jgi:hypothetical protein
LAGDTNQRLRRRLFSSVGSADVKGTQSGVERTGKTNAMLGTGVIEASWMAEAGAPRLIAN